VDSKPQSPPADGTGAPASSEKPRRVIKRYSNRKLYDTKDSRYVTLLQIAEMVRTGEEVQIIDNNTKEDLTEVTLAQIIYEEQKQKASSRNVPPLSARIVQPSQRHTVDDQRAQRDHRRRQQGGKTRVYSR